MAQREDRLVYPPGVRDITEDISTDDLVRRLKDCAQAFQNMSQDDDNSAYIPLALHLASETFLEHPSQDIRLLVACCIADVFRVYAPDAPYKDLTQIKVIFEFFVDQLRGLEDPSKPSFKRYFYLLENFSCVKTFNICVELEDNQKILCRLFRLMFKIINESHSAKVKKFILDMLSPLISEADVVSQELLDILLSHIIEPAKSQNKNACSLAQEILQKNVPTLEPYIQSFFNNALILGKTLQSDVAGHLYELIYELNDICPSMLVVVLPQLEFKLKSNEENERLDVTRVLARMFSDERSKMIEENKTLWSCFLARFNDISPQVRIRCVQYCKNFLLNHPESKDDITEQLKQRSRDVDENVRYEVILAIINAGKEDLSSISQDLLMFVKERTLDKKFKIRKEALSGLAVVYKKHINSPNLSSADLEKISWIKNKVLHAYYQTCLEDRLLVERILHTCLVPFQKPMEERMKLLYQLFCSVDDYAVKAFKEIMKCQSVLRSQMRSILEVVQCEKNENRQRTITTKVAVLSKSLHDPSKSREHILKFCNELESNLKLRGMMSLILNGNITCAEAETNVKEILNMFGHHVQSNTYYMVLKQLLERIAPVMIDREGIQYLVDFVKDSLLGDCGIEAELGLQNSSHRGLELLWVLTFVFPSAFHHGQIYNNLLLFLQVEDDSSADMTLQIFMNISHEMEVNFPEISVKLLPILENFVETGTAKQAKHAVYCINSIVSDKEKVFGNIIENLKKHFTLESQYFRTALVSVGHIAYLCHDMFAADFKTIVAKIVVKDLLMLDQRVRPKTSHRGSELPREIPRGGEETWGPLDSLPDETIVKIEGMKVMVRWLAGLKDMVQPAMSTLRLLTTVILHDGDLMERQHTAPIENSWMRLSAATCMLKLCQEPNYANVITVDQFQVLAYVFTDKCPEVRDRFAQKVHKGLFTLKLPLEFLAVFSLAALDERKEFRNQVKNYLVANINKRKEYIKHRILTGDKLRSVLPDYCLPFAVHLLAHFPALKTYNDVPALLKIKECLWLLMEPLMGKNENYSFSFFKRLLDNIKQTKDKQAADDDNANKKLYAVCDLALSIVMSKSGTFHLKEFPVDPVLPSKFFTEPDEKYTNLKTYLPKELIDKKPMKSGFDIEMFEGAKDTSNASEINTTVPPVDASMEFSQNEDTSNFQISDASIKENHSTTENPDVTSDSRTRTRSKRKTEENKIEESKVEEKKSGENKIKEKKVEEKKKNNSITSSVESSEKTDSEEQIPEENRRPSKAASCKKKSKPDSSSTNDQQPSLKKLQVQIKPLHPSRASSRTSSSRSNMSECSGKPNGILSSSMEVSSLCTPDVQSSLKECNVSLRKDEVEKYIALKSTSSSSLAEDDISDDDFQKSVKTNRSKRVNNVSVVSKKRKREDSPVVQNKLSRRISVQESNGSPKSLKIKAILRSSSSNSSPKSDSSVKKKSKVPMVNGNRASKISQKESSPLKSHKSQSQIPIKKSQRHQNKINLRKR